MELRSIQDEEVIEHHNKEEIENKVMKFNETHFSKVKELKVHKDKMYEGINKDDVEIKCQVEN